MVHYVCHEGLKFTGKLYLVSISSANIRFIAALTMYQLSIIHYQFLLFPCQNNTASFVHTQLLMLVSAPPISVFSNSEGAGFAGIE